MKIVETNHPYRVSAHQIVSHLGKVLEEGGIEVLNYGDTLEEIVEIIKTCISASRLELYEKYKNQKVRVVVGELEVDCFIHDVKVVDGLPLYQVKPVAGDKATWVARFKTK